MLQVEISGTVATLTHRNQLASLRLRPVGDERSTAVKPEASATMKLMSASCASVV